jgi:hypothetical protein
MAGFQLAATAVAANLLTNDQGPPFSKWLSLAACFAFLTGVGVAVYAVARGAQQLQGMNPAWWSGATSISDFELADAHVWIAEHSEKCIAANSAEDERRVLWMRVSLLSGALGCVLVIGAGCVRLVAQL